MGLIEVQRDLDIPELETATIRFGHLRVYPHMDGYFPRWEADKLGLGAPSPQGGLTLCQVELENGHVVRAAARCSNRENFCKAVGRQVALGRAKKKLAEARAQMQGGS